MITVITYGTFDLLHRGHLRLLERLSTLGDRLIVAVSTDEFNEKKGKRALLGYQDRASLVGALRYVDLVIPEETWEQKETDVLKYDVDIFAIGDDWHGKFDHLKEHCDVLYLPRTEGISSTQLRGTLSILSTENIRHLKNSFDLLSHVVRGIA